MSEGLVQLQAKPLDGLLVQSFIAEGLYAEKAVALELL